MGRYINVIFTQNYWCLRKYVLWELRYNGVLLVLYI